MLGISNLVGASDSHVAAFERGVVMHPDAYAAFQTLRESAAGEGFDLRIASAFRSFERQRVIWNAKACGERTILDRNGDKLDASRLSDKAMVYAILRWSALPGGSRHHWGADFDIYDAAAMPEGYKLQLTVAEATTGGVFENMYMWLGPFLEKSGSQLGLCRPYLVDHGGVAVEPWHVSFMPLAQQCEQQLSKDLLATQLQQSEFELKACVMDNFEEIYQRFVRVV